MLMILSHRFHLLFIAVTAQIRGWDKYLFCKVMEHSGNGELTQMICSKGTRRNCVQKIPKQKLKGHICH